MHGAVVALHGAALGGRDQPLFTHLATALVPVGCAVLSFDRRPAPHGGDVTIADQAQDGLAAVEALRSHLEVPVGLYGFSQGAWAAALAAADPRVDRLALVGCSGVSPADQMSYYTDQLLARSGFGEADRAALRDVRTSVEQALRGRGDAERAASLLAAAAGEPWFELAYLPPQLPPPGSWADMDFDPEPVFADVRCPVLLCWGDDDECVPAAAGEQAWRRARATSGAAEPVVVELPRCGHFPAPGVSENADVVPVESFSPAYVAALRDWFGAR